MTPGRIIMIIAAAVMATFGLVLDWAENPAFDDRTGNHPFKYPLGSVAWVVIIVVGGIAGLLVLNVLKREQAPWAVILLAGAAIGAAAMVIQVIIGAGTENIENVGEFDLDPYLGMYVALGAALLSLVGAGLDFFVKDTTARSRTTAA
jgi:hypothetical protein